MTMTNSSVFEGIGKTLEEALSNAHDQIPTRPHRDFAVSRVIDWGMQRGGIVDARRVWVRVVEGEHAPFKSDANP